MTIAAIDVGSNTVRMLLAEKNGAFLAESQYFRQVTRLAGGYHSQRGLSSHSMDRTLQALERFSSHLTQKQVKKIRVVGTAGLRLAANSAYFVTQVKRRTGLHIEIIDGEREAALSCCGILSVLDPLPQRAMFFDIGGGSTEIILLDCGNIQQQMSLPLGVVRLLEDFPDQGHCHAAIHQLLHPLVSNPLWKMWNQEGLPVELVGTAGTVTTLAALKLKMNVYDGTRVNNLRLKRRWLCRLADQLERLSLQQRHELPGMEEGRGDIILPGIQLVLTLLDLADCDSLRVADAGLLEGLLLE